MKKYYISYISAWIITVLAFNVFVWGLPRFIKLAGVYFGSFRYAYGLIMVAFAANLVCAGYIIAKEKRKDVFLGIPILRICYSALIVSLIVGTFFILNPFVPAWIGGTVCFIIVIVNVISVIKASAAAEIVKDVDKTVAKNTVFIKGMTANAESLYRRAETPVSKEKCKLVWEAFRYSDTVSRSELKDIEKMISEEMEVLTDAVIYKDDNAVIEASSEIIKLINDRSIKCKMIKQVI